MPAASPIDAAALRHARQLLARHPVIDGHNDLAWTIRNDRKARGDPAAYDLRRPTPGEVRVFAADRCLMLSNYIVQDHAPEYRAEAPVYVGRWAARIDLLLG